MESRLLEWIRVLGPLVISWPIVGVLVILIFRRPLTRLIKRFTESPESEAAIGPVKFKFGPPVLPPQYSSKSQEMGTEIIDMTQDIGEIRDQGPEGTVVGFSVAYAMQAAIKARSGERVVLSPRSIYNAACDQERHGREFGASLGAALSVAKRVGAYLESDWPYSSEGKPERAKKPAYKISSYTERKGIEGILTAMRQHKVVIVGVHATEDFMTGNAAQDGRIVIRLPLKAIGGHSICLVGYDGKAAEFKFANSWGKDWGANGFGTIRDSDLARILGEAYTLEL